MLWFVKVVGRTYNIEDSYTCALQYFMVVVKRYIQNVAAKQREEKVSQYVVFWQHNQTRH